MESLSSRHFNRKLSNGFSGINAYGDMFSVPAKDGAQKISSRVEDYKLIFGGSNVSSIPVLDLSDQNETSRLGNFRSSEADYSDIFGGFSDEVIGVSYEDLVSPSGDRIFSGNVRTRSAIGSPMKRSDSSTFPKENQLLSSEASFLSFEDKKHFNMSYHKTSAGSKDGSNRSIHVTQFHPEPGFAFFVDDSIPQESKADKPDFPVTSDIRRKLDFSDGILEDKYNKKAVPHLDTQRSSRREINSRTKFKQDGSNSSDKLLNADVIDCRPHLTKERLPPRVAANLDKNNGSTKRSTVFNSEAPEEIAYEHATGDDGSMPFFGEELDVNSAAAVSAAALKDAIQKAQKSIRIAKELMERKKGGLQNRSYQVFKDGLKLKDRKENSIAHEENRTDNTNARGTFENVDSLLNVFSGRRKNASRHGQNAPDLIHNERTSTSGKVTSLHAQNRATSEKREPALSTILNIRKNRTALSSPDQQAVSNSEIVQFMDKQDYDVEERNITRETLMKQEVIVEKKEHDEEDRELGFIKKKIHAVVMDNELEASVDKSAKHVEMEKPIISQKDGDCEKTEIESQQKIEYEMKFESHALKDSDYEKMIPKTQKQDHNKENVNSQQEYIEKTTSDIKKEPDYRPIIICDEDIEEERFEDASEWVQNEDEPKDSHGRESNEDGKEVIRSERRLAKVHDLTIEEKSSIDVHDRKESGQNFGKFELKGSKNGFKGYGYEKIVNIQTGTKKIEALQQVEYESGVNRETVSSSHDASDNITETQGACQPYMIGESLIAKQQLDDNGRSIDKATKDFHDFKAGGAEEAKVAYKVNKMELFETDSLVLGAIKESEDRNNMDTVFEVLPSEGSIPKFGLTDMDNENTESAQRDKDSESNMNLDNGAQISVNGSIEKGYIFAEDEIYWDEKAVKSGHDISNKEGHHVVIIKNSEADPGPSLSSEIEKVIQVDKEMSERQNTQVNGESYCKTIGEEEEETKSDVEMKTENVKQVNDNNPKEVYAIKRTETEKAVSKGVEENEYLRKIYEESKRERRREIDRIAVERVIQEARDRAVAGARERAERAAVERATAEVRQRVMAEARGKLEKATTAAKPSAETAKLRSERAAVERATEEARSRALEKALSHKTTSRAQTDKFVTGNVSGPSRDTAMKDLQRYDETYIESAQRSKARLEREERIMERAAKALAEKNTRDLLAQKEEAEKSRLAESLQTEIKRWSTGKEGNLRALLSTLQYILGPGSGWQPISLTDIITSDAVKKAYRKATLYVHPDKLQQRGASIREKYICEKVFDLLKVAWNRFSSEER